MYWIWPSSLKDSPNQFVQLRRMFNLDRAPEKAVLRISSDSNYAVWVNGEFVGTGQYHDWPEAKSWDVLDITNLKPGPNALAILLYYQGEGSFQYKKGAPGVVFELQADTASIASDSETLYRVDPCYKQGQMPRITGQLGFTFEFDARAQDDWCSLSYRSTSGWQKPSEADLKPLSSRPVAHTRPISKLAWGERLGAKLIAQGLFLRAAGSGGTVAQLMQTDLLSTRNHADLFSDAVTIKPDAAADSTGVYLIYDLGREEAGYLDIDVDAPEGAVLDIAWGEHLDDLRVRAHVGGRNFAGRYICRGGRQQFTHYFTRLAGSYLQVHVSSITSGVKLNYVGVRPVWYPLDIRGSFRCDDTLHQLIYDTSVRTLHLCMHEHYEDCPWREQSLYAMDMRNQALAGYYCFGEYRFPKASLDLLADGLGEDGLLEMCAPAEISITIPSFTLAWILATADHWLHSGDVAAAERWHPTISKVLERCSSDASGGLLPCRTGDRYWHFYDWAPGLEGHGRLQQGQKRYDATLNCFWILALEAAASVAEAAGDKATSARHRQLALDLKPMVHDLFWDASSGLYRTYIGDTADTSHRCEHVQSLAILAGVADPSRAARLRERLARKSNGMVACTLMYMLYKFEALLQDQDRYEKLVFDTILDTWGAMVTQGATSFWETILGGDDFGNAGSLCHGWSGIPAYFYHAYVLGTRPTAPGFARHTNSPRRGLVGSAEGQTPTASGAVSSRTDTS